MMKCRGLEEYNSSKKLGWGRGSTKNIASVQQDTMAIMVLATSLKVRVVKIRL